MAKIIDHTRSCVEHLAWLEDMKEQEGMWVQLHPDFCRMCNGGGTLVDPGDASVGISESFYTCPACIDKGKCPVCGLAHGLTLDTEADGDAEVLEGASCYSCGWRFLEDESLQDLINRTAGLPDCICDYDERRYATYRDFYPETPMSEEELEKLIADSDHAYEEWRDRGRSRF